MYPRISKLVKTDLRKSIKITDIGKPMTIPNQAMTLTDIVQRAIKGFPIPMMREELKLHPDLNQVLKGSDLKIASDATFRQMSKVERQQYINNLGGLKQQLTEKVQAEIKKANEKSTAIEAQPPQTPAN